MLTDKPAQLQRDTVCFQREVAVLESQEAPTASACTSGAPTEALQDFAAAYPKGKKASYTASKHSAKLQSP